MIKPRKKFDTIMEEYMAVRSKFDNVKKKIGADQGAAGDTGKGEIQMLQ